MYTYIYAIKFGHFVSIKEENRQAADTRAKHILSKKATGNWFQAPLFLQTDEPYKKD